MKDISEGTTIDNEYTVLNKLGSGDTGTVYRVKQLGINVDRAMKILDPKLHGINQETFSREFAAEIKKLSVLTHRNLVKLIDAGVSEYSGTRFSYYVTDLVHPRVGEAKALTLDKWAVEVETREQFVSILLQLTDGLSYLHSHLCLHCDIKPSNLLLEPVSDHNCELKVADLGSSKILPASGMPNTQRTHVIGTIDYAPDYVQDIINTEKTIPVSDLQKWFPHWDLFCLGATLARIMWNKETPGERDFKKMLDHPKEKIKRLFGKEFDVLQRIILRLVDPDMNNCFTNISSVEEAFKKFLPEYLVPLTVIEMAIGGAYRTITQPREKVYLSERAYELIETPAFQRLHNLSQLNFVFMLYPGAKHSRFLHSLSTYEMAKRYIEGLLGNSYFKYLMYKEDFEILLASALLHDIGQYPLAHAIEDLGDEQFMGRKVEVKTDYQMAEFFLTHKANSRQPTIADLLRKNWGINYDRLVMILSRGHRKTETDYLIRSVLDGPIDVDKVSYLLYDSYFTGAQYGLGIDLGGFLASLVAIPPENDSRHSQIGILDEGIVAAEGIISARYSMFSRVYWHHFNRGIMTMLKYAATKIFLSPDKICSFDGYIHDTFGFSDLDAVRYIHDRLGRVIPLKSYNPLDGLLNGSRMIHRRFLTFSGRPTHKTNRIYRLLLRYHFQDLETLRMEILDRIGKIWSVKLEDYDVLFDIPKAEKTTDTLEDLYIYNPEDRSEEYRKISDISGVTKALCDEFEYITKKCRIYISDGLRKKLLSDENQAKNTRVMIEDYLRQKADEKIYN